MPEPAPVTTATLSFNLMSVLADSLYFSVRETRQHFGIIVESRLERETSCQTSRQTGLLEALRWKLTSRPESSPRFIPDVEQSTPPRRVEGSGLRATLVNHSTVLLQQRGSNILTDPIWSERASPLSWIGSRRRRKPGVSGKDLPCIDAVLISHNHYDHLDLPTLRGLTARGDCIFVVPARVARMLRSENIGPTHELDWGESLSLPGFTIHCVPALHFSSRGIFDRNKTLWCGYAIECQDRLVYFAGDTAFGRHFAQIREKFGSPHLALLPIGAYEPRWFMSPVHMAPDEAVRAHEIMAAKTTHDDRQAHARVDQHSWYFT